MPFIIVHGIPDAYGVGDALERLTEKISEAVATVKELTLTGPAPVSVYFSMDMLDSEDRKILALILPFDKPERNADVLNALSEAVGKALKSEFPNKKVRAPCVKIYEGVGWFAAD